MRRYILSLSGGLFISLLLGNFALADTELYGSIQYGYENKQSSKLQYQGPSITQNPSNSYAGAHSSERKSNLNSEDSFIGIKGEKEIGNGNAIIYQFEVGKDQ
ncbi:hypothetical protein [Ignatzschineria sp. LJL83]